MWPSDRTAISKRRPPWSTTAMLSVTHRVGLASEPLATAQAVAGLAAAHAPQRVARLRVRHEAELVVPAGRRQR